jgi:N-acetylmuramoyl-L-alanine amidase
VITLKSPNQSKRPAGAVIDAIVLHADAGKSEQGTISWMLDPESKVSYHYFISRQGDVYRFVDESAKAWHAGKSIFQGRPDCNAYSIGVAFANDQKGELFGTTQIDAGVALVARIARGRSIPASRITTHAAIAPGRKSDPGPLFDFDAFIARVEAMLR